MPQIKQCLGIDLGANSIKIVELALQKGSVRVLKAATSPTGVQPGMPAEDVRAALVSTVKSMLKEHKFSSRKAIFSISGQKVFVRKFTLPAASPDRLHKIIQYEARQQIPFPLDKTILQYQHRHVPEQKEVEVLLTAVRSDEVRDFMQVVGRCGVKAVAVGVTTFSLFNAQTFMGLEPEKAAEKIKALTSAPGKKAKKAPPAPEGEEQEEFVYQEVKAFVDIGATTCDLAIAKVEDGEPSFGFTRTIPLGGDELTRSIQKALKVERFHDAERIKISSTSLAGAEAAEGDLNEEAAGAIERVAERLASEIRRSIEFYMTQPDGVAVDSVVLSGGQALLPGMEEHLEDRLTAPAELLNEPPEGSPLVWKDDAGSVAPYVVALGSALQGIGLGALQVDFLPEEQKIIRDFPYKMAAALLAMVIGTVAVAANSGRDYVDKYQAEAGNIEMLTMRTGDSVRQFNELQGMHEEVAGQFDELEKLFGDRDYWVDTMIRIWEIKPAGVVIDDMRGGHEGNFRIQGRSPSQSEVATFRNTLMEEFEERTRDVPSLDDFQQATTGEGWTFTISMELRDKRNHLSVTPTPTPGAPGRQPFTGRVPRGPRF